MNPKISFAFTHADLTIGGAEQLILLTTFGLLKRGHNVTIYTAHHNPNNSLTLPSKDGNINNLHTHGETTTGKFELIVCGSWIPRTIFGRFYHLLAIIKMLWICLFIAFSGRTFDIIINDQVPAINPFLSYFSKKIIFYGHFPNHLLSNRKMIFPYTLYKSLMDYIEVKSTGLCDKIYVNSEFTKSAFKNSKMSHLDMEVLYPPINFDNLEVSDNSNPTSSELASVHEIFNPPGPVFLSINRYERKKSIEIAIKALAIANKEDLKFKPKLIIAGGLDERVSENVKYFNELKYLADQLELGSDQIRFLTSISNNLRNYLFKMCTALIYTPYNEHFGMVPCEAMAMKLPVIASNSGGPKESIINNETGFLCHFTEADFAEKILKIINFYVNSPKQLKQIGEAAQKHVKQKFNLDKFLDSIAIYHYT